MKTFFSGRSGKKPIHHPPSFRGTALLCCLFLGSACYSAEFYPVPEYPNLKREVSGEVELRYSRPTRAHRELGSLWIRDFSGDPSDETFRAFLKKEIRSRGAQGGWIARRRFHRQVQYETGTVSRSRPGAFSPTGEIQGRVGVLKVMLYNYEE